MKTPSVVVICESGTPMALAFSRSMVTSTWGSFAEKVVSRFGYILARAASRHNLMSHAIQIGKRIVPLVLKHELEAAITADSRHRRRLHDRDNAAIRRNMSAVCSLGERSATMSAAEWPLPRRSAAGLRLANIMPALEEAPLKLKPTMEKAPMTS